MIHSFIAIPGKSTAHFKLHNTLIPDVEGSFDHLRGKFIYDPDNLDKALIEAYIDVKTVTTGRATLDSEFKGPDFFDVLNYPVIEFHSKKFDVVDKDILRVLGDLTVKSITKEVVLNVERPDKSEVKQMSLAASTIINREEFGLDLGKILEVGEVLVGDNIQITMHIQLTKE